LIQILLAAIRAKDWATLQHLSRSPDPTIRAAAYEAADCIPEAEFSGTPWERQQQ
jgi:hypothetical protein